MKPLKDLSVFQGDLPLWKSSGSYRCCYRKNNTVSRMDPVSIDRFAIREPFYCIGVCDAEMRENSHLRSENPPMCSVERIVSGSLLCRIGTCGYLAEAGDVIVFPPEVSFEFMTGPEGFCRKVSLVLEGPMLLEAVRRYGLEAPGVIPGMDPLEMDRLSAKISAIPEPKIIDATEGSPWNSFNSSATGRKIGRSLPPWSVSFGILNSIRNIRSPCRRWRNAAAVRSITSCASFRGPTAARRIANWSNAG